MNLWELSNVAARRPSRSVPDWTLGCFRRKSITYFEGSTDAATEVIWLQTRGLTADFRFSPTRPRHLRQSDVRNCDPETRAQLLEVEAGASRTEWDGATMSWHDWVGFQMRVKWPEAAILRRVGDCLIEFAPSGAYVEDWRFQPQGSGPLLGLELLEERDARDGTLLHRGGALILCGHHAAFVRGRPGREPSMSSADRQPPQPSTVADLPTWLSCEGSYGVVSAAKETIVVVSSTSPWREGQALLALDGFEVGEDRDIIVQRVVEEERPLERRFRIDSIETSFEPAVATPLTDDGRAWFERESATLLSHAHVASTSRSRP